MAQRLRDLYLPNGKISIVSNSAFVHCQLDNVLLNRKKIKTIGFLGNIEEEKGIFDFLEIIKILADLKIDIRALIAGPFIHLNIQKMVMNTISEFSNVDYVGPKYGLNKDLFWGEVDVLLFPTRNDAEPLTVIESLSFGVPVLTRDRGCLGEIITPAVGDAIHMDEDYIDEVVAKLKLWIDFPDEYIKASISASRKFKDMKFNAETSLKIILNEVIR